LLQRYETVLVHYDALELAVLSHANWMSLLVGCPLYKAMPATFQMKSKASFIYL
jgi:hypothetical protein